MSRYILYCFGTQWHYVYVTSWLVVKSFNWSYQQNKHLEFELIKRWNYTFVRLLGIKVTILLLRILFNFSFYFIIYLYNWETWSGLGLLTFSTCRLSKCLNLLTPVFILLYIIWRDIFNRALLNLITINEVHSPNR